MRCTIITLILTLSLVTGTAVADFKQSSFPARSFASPGDVAVGAIVRETDDRLELNIAPCANAPTVIVYRKPYVKDTVQTVHCGSTATSQVQVMQK